MSSVNSQRLMMMLVYRPLLWLLMVNTLAMCIAIATVEIAML